jgi:small subunit ribosomal protein S13
MAEENKEQKPEEKKQGKKPKDKGKPAEAGKKKGLIGKEVLSSGKIIRILQTDIPGNKNLYTGLTKIKGVSWAISNAVSILLGFDKKTKIQDLSKEEIAKIEELLKNPKFPKFLINRKNDFATGEDKHLIGSDLDLVKEFDIKRLKKIRSYRGLRHATGQPTRGQRTKGHFRDNRKKGVGIKVKKKSE